MPNEDNSDSPSPNSKNKPVSQSPVSQPAPEKNEMGDKADHCSQDKEDKTTKLEQDIKTGEICLITINVLLLVTTIIIAFIYNGQLNEMRKATEATEIAARAAKNSVDLQFKVAEGSQAASLLPSEQTINRNFLRFGVQNMGGISAENVAVIVQMKLFRVSDNQVLWTESFAYETVKYLAPKENTNGQTERTLSKYTRQDFNRLTKRKEILVLNWSATFDNGFKRGVQQSGCVEYIALFKSPQVAAVPQWIGCEGAPQILRGLQPPSEQWSLQ